MESMHLLAGQPTSSVCISSCFCLFFNNWLKSLISKPHNMIIVFKFPNSKCNLGDTKNLKLRSVGSCERSHVKTKKTVTHCKRASPRVLLYLDTKTCPRSTCYRFKFHLRKYQGAENPMTAAWLLW